MKTKNLWMFILVIGLVLGMAACNPEGDDFGTSDPEYWIGTYTAPVKVSGSNKETIIITESTFNISDETTDVFKMNIKIEDWKETTPPEKYEIEYPYAFELSGTLYDVKGEWGENTNPDKIQKGGKLFFYIYFKENGDSFTFVRTPVSKGDATGDAIHNSLVKDSEGKPRVYTKQED